MTDKVVSPIIILGMHRSGTSCLAGSFQQAGVNLGEVSNQNKFNLKGNKENFLIMSLNNDLLKHNNASWDTPPQGKLLWNDTHIAKGREIKKLFSSDKAYQPWGFKDPRTLLTIDYWNSLFPSASFVGSFRHPSNVALSLSRRDRTMTYDNGLDLWLHYNNILLKLLKKKAFPLISFDISTSEYVKQINKIVSHVLLKEVTNADTFYESSLRNNSLDSKLPNRLYKCYEELTMYNQKNNDTSPNSDQI